MVARMSEQLGRVLGGRYRLVAAIGTGASAQVFLADDLTLQRRVAVKVLHPALATDEAFLRRFRAEARAAAALSHPNLMAVYDWGEDDGPYLVLEYLGGGSLRSVLDRGGRLTPAQALVVGLDAARALDVAHRSGFVHRDIKPANLLFGEDGRLRIADFGLARALSEAGWTEPGDGLVGTARYAAPEQARGGRVDGKADVYSLGLVLVEAVTGSVPLVREGALETMMARVETSVPVPDELGPLQEVLERCGRADPAERPDAAELGRTLVAAAREMERPAPLTLPGHDLSTAADDITVFPEGDELTVFRGPDATGVLPAVEAKRRRRWPWVLLALLVAAAIAAGAIYASRQLATPTAPVPGVVTKPIAEARAAIEEADAADDDVAWTIDEEAVFDDNVPAGNVVSQRPVEGTELEDGGTITLVVSRGPPPVDVPGLDNATVESATAALTAVELKVGAVTEEHHEVIAPGAVINWKVGDELRPAQVPKFSAVDLVVSSGPAPREVPNLRGKAPGEAKAELEGRGLVYAEARDFSDDVPEGQVIGTTPGAGQRVGRGSTVTVVISRGPDLVTVPDVSSAGSLDEAAALLESAGLVPGEVHGPARGRPFATDPEAGARIKRGRTVDIYLRR